MNLLEEAWMPVRCHNGERVWVRPAELARADLATFDADRADFNGALAQFAIGLLQTGSPIDSGIEWRRLLKQAPDEATLRGWFAPHVAAFEFDGDGARFMQDFDLRASDGDAVPISGLLIDAASVNATKENRDHFVKRQLSKRFCPHCAALALFTLQVNAPSGGSGHRTGLRDGGPLTTLLIADGNMQMPRSLWHSVWLNVLARHAFEAGRGDADKTSPRFTFPWVASIQALQPHDGQTSPTQVHPAHVFWAMPRRIRLDQDTTSIGLCDLCTRPSERLVHRYVTRKHGLDYKGAWSHPLSPHKESDGSMRPIHPRPGGLGYRNWLGWVLGMQTNKRKVTRAAVIESFLEMGAEQHTGIGLRLWAFGYDFVPGQANARCWYDATLPLYALPECTVPQQRALRADVGTWLAGAELAASYLRGAVKDAWFSHDARGDFSFVDASFWSRTEADFYRLLRERIQADRDAVPVEPAVASERWLTTLRSACLRIFDDELVGTGAIERQNPGRVATARKRLLDSLGGPKLRGELALPVEPKPAKRGKSGPTP